MLKKTLVASALTAAAAGAILASAPSASADDDIMTSGNGSILGGNQIVADLNVPVNVCGNGIGILGNGGGACHKSGAMVWE
ncbi:MULTISPECIES: DUF320 domain-containing protein [Streptomonospora]|uniref:DUF320 domain-containing protein n=2 Tax=Streptomonospora TaxID=104204 RepID=A0ABV9SU61_9ACTN